MKKKDVLYFVFVYLEWGGGAIVAVDVELAQDMLEVIGGFLDRVGVNSLVGRHDYAFILC